MGLGRSDDFVGEIGKVVNGPAVDKAHRHFGARLIKEPVTGAEHDRVDHQPHLVDQILLHESVHQLDAARDDDFSILLSMVLGAV